MMTTDDYVSVSVIMRTESNDSKDGDLRNQEMYSASLPIIAPLGILHEAPSLPLYD